jgi:glucosamine 6-phosphate synthetase-like amidotransferase/phosphosugar isomerase protein
MCGIAGYSVAPESQIDRTLAAQALLAGIAERGADAVGYAFRSREGLTVHKQQSGASALLDTIRVPSAARQTLVHVRDFTKGHPTIAANNHPIRHGRVVGIHNGIIANDDELFVRHGFERHEPGMTVDSEAIFALVDALGTGPGVLEELVGTMASAWIDERDPRVLHVARGIGRPLWLARGRHEALFASTRDALEVAERALATTFRKTQVEEGRLLSLVDGELVEERRWSPDRSFREERELPAVRAPHEGRSCLDRLWAIVAPAT